MHYNVFRKQKRQQSSDNGVTWVDVVPAEYQKGSFIRENTTCSEDDSVQEIFKWDDDNLLVTQNDGLTWESTGVEREDSMSDAPDSVKEINGRATYHVEVEYNEYFCVQIPDIEGMIGWQLDVYENEDRTGTKSALAGFSNNTPIALKRSNNIAFNFDDVDDLSYQYTVNKLVPFRCKAQGGTTFYFTFMAFGNNGSSIIYQTNNVSVVHDYNPPHYDDRGVRNEESNEPTRRVPVDYNSYYLYQKYARSSTLVGENWYPAFPFEYSASTEVAVQNDPECGYVSPTFLQYRWIDTDGIICDEVSDEPVYSWQETGSHLCYGGSSYAVECYMVSYNGGLTWSPVPPPEYRKGRLIQANSDECNQTVEVLYRVSKSSLGSTFKVISSTAGIESAVLDGDVEIPVNNGYMDTSWLADGSTGFTLTFTIPSGYMQDELFSGIGFIQTVTLRQGVTYIGDKCFYGTTLSDFYVYGKSVYLGDSALPSSISAIYVPSDRVAYYKSAYHWSSYSSIISSMS